MGVPEGEERRGRREQGENERARVYRHECACGAVRVAERVCRLMRTHTHTHTQNCHFSCIRAPQTTTDTDKQTRTRQCRCAATHSSKLSGCLTSLCTPLLSLGQQQRSQLSHMMSVPAPSLAGSAHTYTHTRMPINVFPKQSSSPAHIQVHLDMPRRRCVRDPTLRRRTETR